MRAVMAELFGKTTGVCRGQGGSMHMFSSEYNVLGGFAFIGEGIPVRRRAADGRGGEGEGGGRDGRQRPNYVRSTSLHVFTFAQREAVLLP